MIFALAHTYICLVFAVARRSGRHNNESAMNNENGHVSAATPGVTIDGPTLSSDINDTEKESKKDILVVNNVTKTTCHRDGMGGCMYRVIEMYNFSSNMAFVQKLIIYY